MDEHNLCELRGVGDSFMLRDNASSEAARVACEARRAANRFWLAGGGVDSRGGRERSAAPMPAASDPADARLWRSVHEALFRNGYRAIDVSVSDGLVTLAGTVEDIPTRVMAEYWCLDLPEVRDVDNRLRVLPAASLEREVGG